VRRGAEGAVIIRDRDPGEVDMATSELRRSDALGMVGAGRLNVVDLPDLEPDCPTGRRARSTVEGNRSGADVRSEAFFSDLPAESVSRR
jgi:hypothetical protein